MTGWPRFEAGLVGVLIGLNDGEVFELLRGDDRVCDIGRLGPEVRVLGPEGGWTRVLGWPVGELDAEEAAVFVRRTAEDVAGADGPEELRWSEHLVDPETRARLETLGISCP